MRSVALPLLAALALAGCVAPLADDGSRAALLDAAVAEGPVNLFLLDAPRPFQVRVSGGAEPMILATRDGSTLLVGDVTGLYRSTDGGATWKRAPDPFLPGVFADGWALAEDEAGTLYAADTQGQVIGVAASMDHGASWDVQSKIVEASSIADRPWLAARGDGEVLLIMNGDRGESCTRSDDGGRTWLSRSLVNWGDANPGNIAYDSKGRAWMTNGVHLQQWTTCFPGGPSSTKLPAMGAQIFTQLAIDPQDRIHIAAPSPGNGQMMLTTRIPGEITQIPVSPPELLSNTFGAIAAHGDEIAIGWYGSEVAGDPADDFDGAWNVYVARIRGYATPTQQIVYDRLTTEPNHVGGFCMGGVSCGTAAGPSQADRDLLDYFGVAYGPDGTLHVAYGHDGTSDRAEVRYARLAPLAAQG